MEHLNPTELQQLRTDMKDMKGKVDKMFYALMGNEIAKDGGLVGRIEHLETVFEKMEEKVDKLSETNIKMQVYQRIMWTSIGFVAASIFSYVLSLIFK
jgi:hypothetical protein